MVSIYYKDERIKVAVFVIIALIVQGLIFSIIYFININNINRSIIEQNKSIIGTIATRDEVLVKEIIPIITTNKKANMELGRQILSNYSYDNNLKFYSNPLIESSVKSFLLWIAILLLFFIAVMVIGIFTVLNPLYSKIKYLTFRAEKIIENKFTNDDNKEKYSGSLDKFSLKFYQMEDRIKNSLNLLQQEKVNLKNIINDISHQLKTPLMALQMYNEILKDHKNMEEADINNFVELSSEQLGRMEWLVKTLLKYARLESNVVQYHKEDIPINRTIEESINPLIIKADEKNQSLIFKDTKEIIFMHDRKWISEALSNIIKNAIEHTGVGGKIEVELEETPISIRISIKDNGEGIQKDKLKKIFERFYKGENAINPTSIGIGLSLSKSIVRAHNGDITVESEVGKGSTFYVTFIKSAIA